MILSVVLLSAVGAAIMSVGLGLGFALLTALLAVPLAARLSRSIVHFTVQPFLPENGSLPRLDLAGGLPAECATCVVYPVIVHDEDDADALVSTMQCNRVECAGMVAQVALVDFADSATEHLPTDESLRAYLADRLAAAGFSALYRTRRWNGVERMWMGWERKRGKLVEFIRLIEGCRTTSFVVDRPADRAVVELLGGVRFVITLDLGSRLLPGAARRLVATMAHPDNRPVLDRSRRRVVSGFTFLRPRYVHGPPRSLFQWAAGPPGTALSTAPLPGRPASAAAASTLQRISGSDLFFGQGIIDVAAFGAVLADRIPENTVLSHDKLEGLIGRAACVTDATLLDANPDDYLGYRRRSHRWTRGDVHVARWIFGRGPLTPFDRWLLLDDLLLDLRPVSALALLVLGWLAAPGGYALGWTLSVVAVLAEPVVLQPLAARAGARTAAKIALAEGARWLIWLSLLLDQALLSADAAARAWYRSAVSRRHILRWTSFARQARLGTGGWRHRWSQLRAVPAAALALAVLIAVTNRSALVAAAPLLTAWFLSPQIAYRISMPLTSGGRVDEHRPGDGPTGDDRAHLRGGAAQHGDRGAVPAPDRRRRSAR